MKIAHAVMAVVFAASLAVQFNDPDPWRWAVIYAAAGLASLGAALGWPVRWPAAAIAVVALGWMVITGGDAIGKVPPGEWFGALGMNTDGVEEAREFGGLLVVAAWMVVVAVTTAGRPRPRD